MKIKDKLFLFDNDQFLVGGKSKGSLLDLLCLEPLFLQNYVPFRGYEVFARKIEVGTKSFQVRLRAK